MSTISASLPMLAARTPAPAPPAPPANPPKHDITIGQAVDGLASAVVVAGIEGVGNTASSLINAPRTIGQAYKTLWNTEQIGPVLKTSIGLLIPAAAVAAPVLTALGSVGFGLFRGFSSSLDGGMKKAVHDGTSDVKMFNKEVSGQLIKGLQDYETEKLPPGQKPFDIHVLAGAKGLVGGIGDAALDGAGVGLITLAKTPKGVAKVYHEIWTSDQGPVLRTTESLLVPVAAVLATPLATVGGAVWGLATGFQKGYQEGLGSSIEQGGKNVKEFNKMTTEMLKD